MRKGQWIVGALAGLWVLGSVASAHAEGFELGARAGYGIPLGKASGGTGNNDLSQGISGMIPLQLDIGYRVIPSLMVGGYFMYGFGFTGSQISDGCKAAEAHVPGLTASCSTHDLRLGIQANYHFTPEGKVDPWIGAGFGYEWLGIGISESAGGQTVDLSTTGHGWEFISLHGGADFSLAPNFGLGPFVALSFAQYSTSSSSCSGSCAGFTSESTDIKDKALHEWLMLGVHGSFLL